MTTNKSAYDLFWLVPLLLAALFIGAALAFGLGPVSAIVPALAGVGLGASGLLFNHARNRDAN